VLARKGSPAPRNPGAPLQAPRRSGRMKIATGGSGGMSLEAILLERKPEVSKPAKRLHKIPDTTGYRGGVNYEKVRKFRCVNCWHMNDYESAAMWDLYSNTDGVAIRSRFSRLAQAFPGTGPIRSWGIRGENVRYLDYEVDLTAGETSEGLIAHTPGVFCKRRSFEHEREYRLVISLEEAEAENTGLFVPILLGQLIEQIIVSPNAPRWVAEVVRKEVAVHGLSVEVVRSELYSPLLK
jgi:hypothetical protein